jgi:hypothetical protein
MRCLSIQPSHYSREVRSDSSPLAVGCQELFVNIQLILEALVTADVNALSDGLDEPVQ